MTAFDALAPYVAAVGRAQANLDTHNADRSANPLDGLTLAGYTIRAHQAALDAALHALRYADGCGAPYDELRMQGRHNRAALTESLLC